MALKLTPESQTQESYLNTGVFLTAEHKNEERAEGCLYLNKHSKQELSFLSLDSHGFVGFYFTRTSEFLPRQIINPQNLN